MCCFQQAKDSFLFCRYLQSIAIHHQGVHPYLAAIHTLSTYLLLTFAGNSFPGEIAPLSRTATAPSHCE